MLMKTEREGGLLCPWCRRIWNDCLWMRSTTTHYQYFNCLTTVSVINIQLTKWCQINRTTWLLTTLNSISLGWLIYCWVSSKVMDTTWARLPATVQEYEPALLPLNPQEGTDTIHKRAMEIKPRCNSILTRNTEYTMEHAAYHNPFLLIP